MARIVKISDMSNEEKKKWQQQVQNRERDRQVNEQTEIERVNNILSKLEDTKPSSSLISDIKGGVSNFARSIVNLGTNAFQNLGQMTDKTFENREKIGEDLKNEITKKRLEKQGYTETQIQEYINNTPTLKDYASNHNTLNKISGVVNNVLSPLSDANLQKIEDANNQRIQENINNASNPVSKKILELTPSVAQSAVNLIPGGSLVFASGITQSYYEEAKEQRGMKDEEADKYASIMAGLETISEMIGASLTKKVGSALFKGNVKSALKNFGLDIGENFLEEAVMEPMGELTATVVAGKEKANWDNIGERTLKAGIDGALASILLGGASAGVGSAGNLINKLSEGKTVTQNELKSTLEDVQRSQKVEVEAIFKNEMKKAVEFGKGTFYTIKLNENGQVQNVEQTLGKEIENPNKRVNISPVIVYNKSNESYNIIDKNTGILFDATPYESLIAAKIGFNKKMVNLDSNTINSVNNKMEKASYALQGNVEELKAYAESVISADKYARQNDTKTKQIESNSNVENSKESSFLMQRKQMQLEEIKKNNPAEDDYHTWIRNIEDIKTFEETLQDSDWEGWEENGFDPDYTGDMAKEALSTGKITVYSSYPIKQGIFVTPSRMEAESYSESGKIYSKEVKIEDVAWIDPTQGQYAKVKITENNIEKENNRQEIIDKVKYNPDGKEIKDTHYVEFLADRYIDKKNISGVETDTQETEKLLQDTYQQAKKGTDNEKTILNKQKELIVNDMYKQIKEKQFQIAKQLLNEKGQKENRNLDLEITKKGLKESLHKSISQEKIAVMPYIDILIKTSENGIIRNETKQRSNVNEWYYIYNTALINDKLYGVKIDIRKTPQGDRFYVHRVNLINKEGFSNQIPSNGSATIKIKNPSSIDNSISQKSDSVKGTTVNNKDMQKNGNNADRQQIIDKVKYNPDGKEIKDTHYVEFLADRYVDKKNISGVETDTQWTENLLAKSLEEAKQIVDENNENQVRNKQKKIIIDSVYNRISNREFSVNKTLLNNNEQKEDITLNVEISKKGLNETLNKGISVEKISVMPYLDKLIMTSQDGIIRNESKKRANVDEWYYLYNTAIIDNELYGVKIDIKKTPQGDKFYVHRVHLINKKGTSNQIPAFGNGTIKISKVPSINNSISQNSKTVKGTTVNNKDMQKNGNNAEHVRNKVIKYLQEIESNMTADEFIDKFKDMKITKAENLSGDKKKLYDLIMEVQDANNSVLKEEEGQYIDKVPKIEYNDKGIKISTKEFNNLKKAINTDNPNMPNGLNYKNHGDYFYIFNKNSFDNYKILGKIKIIDNEQIINQIMKEVEDHDRATSSVDRLFKRSKNEQTVYIADNINAKNSRTATNDGGLSSRTTQGDKQFSNRRATNIKESNRNNKLNVKNSNKGSFSNMNEEQESYRYAYNELKADKKDNGVKVVNNEVIYRKFKQDFIDKGYTNLNDAKIESREDLADMAQIFRNPKYETFRIIYMKGNIVVGHEAISSKIPNASKMIRTDQHGKANYAKEYYKINDRMKRLNADGYYMVHNHPAGSAKASREDIVSTNVFRKNVKGFKGHLILNSGTYAWIYYNNLENNMDWENEVKIQDYKQDEIDKLMNNNPTIDNITLNDVYEITRLIDNVKNTENYSVMIYADSKLKTRMVQEVHNSFFNMQDEQILGYLRKQAINNGASKVFFATNNEETYKKSEKLTRSDILMDSVLYKWNTLNGFNVPIVESMRRNKQIEYKGNGLFKDEKGLRANETFDEVYEMVQKTTKQRRFYKNMYNSNIPQAMREELIKNRENYTYIPINNKQTLDKVYNDIDNNIGKAKDKFMTMKELTKAEDTVLGEVLITNAIANKNYEEANIIGVHLAEKLTIAGQTIQAASIFNKLSPEGMLMFANKKINEINHELEQYHTFTGKTKSKLSTNVKNIFGGKTPKLEMTTEKAEFIVEKAKRLNELETEKTEILDISDEEILKQQEKITKELEELKNQKKELSESKRIEILKKEKETRDELKEITKIKNKEKKNIERLNKLEEYKKSLTEEQKAEILKLEEISKAELKEIRRIKNKEKRNNKRQQKIEQLKEGLSDEKIKKIFEEEINTKEELQELKHLMKLAENNEKRKVQVENKKQELIEKLGRDVEEKQKEIKQQLERLEELKEKRNNTTNAIAVEKIEREQAVVRGQILAKISEGVPVSILEKLAAWRHISLLLTGRTVLRNVLGNSLFSVMENVTDVVSIPLDILASKKTGTRSMVLPSVSTQLSGAKKGLQYAIEDSKLGINTGYGESKYNVTNNSKFKNKTLKKLEKVSKFGVEGLDRPFMQAAYEESLRKIMKIEGLEYGKDIPTDEMKREAQEEAEYRTFKNKTVLGNLVSDIRRDLNLGEDIGVADAIGLTYTNAPSNLITKAIDYSPVGIFRMMARFGDLRKSLKTGENVRTAQKRLVQATTRTLIGSGIMYVSIQAALLGIISASGDDEEDKVKYLKQSMGHQNYSLNVSALWRWVRGKSTEPKEGDVFVTYSNYEPISAMISVGAEIASVFKEEKDISTAILNASEVWINTFLEMSTLSTFADVFTWGNPGQAFMKQILQFPASFIPNFSKQVAQMIDPYTRSTYSDNRIKQNLINPILAKIPGASFLLEKTYTTLGKERKSYNGSTGIGRAFNVFLNPSFVSTVEYDDVQAELYDLYDATGLTDHLPKYISSREITYKGQKIKLTEQERAEYQKQLGQKTGEEFKKIMATEEYQKLNYEEKVKKLSSIIQDIDTEVRGDVVLEKRGLAYNTKFSPSKSYLEQNNYKLDLTTDMQKEYEKYAEQEYNRLKKQGILTEEKMIESAKKKAKTQMFQTYKNKLVKAETK